MINNRDLPRLDSTARAPHFAPDRPILGAAHPNRDDYRSDEDDRLGYGTQSKRCQVVKVTGAVEQERRC